MANVPIFVQKVFDLQQFGCYKALDSQSELFWTNRFIIYK
jgi:hypothetical protein